MLVKESQYQTARLEFSVKLAIFFGVYEAEKSFARSTLKQLLEILQGHEVYVLILDDASPSRVGDSLLKAFSDVSHVKFELIRNESSSGFRGAMARTLSALHHISLLNQDIDYILRVDADLFFNRKELALLFDSNKLPKTGMCGVKTTFRWRDLVLLLADLFPIGFRRRQRQGVVEHKWELRRLRPVWWCDLGFRALVHGFNRRFIGGPFQIIAGSTLTEWAQRGWLKRKPLTSLGLIFGEDVMTNMMVKALNHPLVDLAELVPDWACDMAINPHKGGFEFIQANRYYLVHPLKGDAWGLRLRQELERLQVGQL
jgi:hypothetical protein